MKKLLFTLSLALMAFTAGCAKRPAQTAAAPQSAETSRTAATAAVPSVVKTLPTTIKGEAVVKALADAYKGKVVLIDFWATWCGPCRAAMKQVDAIKEDLAKKGCVFVYVTGETSPYGDWERMIKTIGGDHYRLTDAQWNAMCKTLNIPGIPAYLLLGKDGKTAYDNLSEGGYPGNEVLQNNIEVALTK